MDDPIGIPPTKEEDGFFDSMTEEGGVSGAVKGALISGGLAAGFAFAATGFAIALPTLAGIGIAAGIVGAIRGAKEK